MRIMRPSSSSTRPTTTAACNRSKALLRVCILLIFYVSAAISDVSSKEKHRHRHRHRSLQDDLITVPDDVARFIPAQYFDWTLYKQLQFGITWNREPSELIRDYLLPQALSVWTEALHVYPQEQPLTLTSPECSSVIIDYAEKGVFRGPDVLLFITTSDNNDTDKITTETCRSPVVASPCAYHPLTKRPIAGIVRFCNTAILTKEHLGDTIRQIGYMLGLNPRLYSTFVNSETQQFQTPSPGAIPGCIDVQMPSQQTISSYQLVTPLALQVMRNHVDCQSLPGIVLLDDFCLGEPVLLWNTAPNVLTPLALALLEDSGWYAAHYDFATSPIQGYHAGCDYVSTLVFDEEGALAQCQDTCTSSADSSSASLPCDPSHSTIVSCLSRRDCPTSVVDCTSADGGRSVATVWPQETFGSLSKCFNTNAARAICLHTRCLDNGNAVVTVGGKKYTCTKGGQEFLIDDSLTWKCPDSLELLCPQQCTNECVGRGICDSTTKTCDCANPKDAMEDCTSNHVAIGMRYNVASAAPSSASVVVSVGASFWIIVLTTVLLPLLGILYL